MNSRIFKTTALTALFVFSLAANGGMAIAAAGHSGGQNMKKDANAEKGHGAKMGHGAAMGHGAEKGGGHAMAIGEPGDTAKVDRTIAITMSDNFFEPETFSVKEGETIRFVITNKGEFLHEFNIGTAAMHAAHQSEMTKMMESGMLTPTGIDHSKMMMGSGGGKMMMQHNDPNSVLVEPGKKAEVIWRFSKVAKLEFACNVPGHYESGMMGGIKIKPGH